MATEGDADDVDGTIELPAGEIPEVAPLALVAARRAASIAAPEPAPEPEPEPPSIHSNTTAVAALRDDEVERTRLFIRMGWALSVAVIGTVPFVDAPRAMSAALVTGLVIGMIVSFFYHRAFADPRRYTERALLALAVMCTLNGSLGVMYYGAFTAAPLMIVVGIHFVARTEAERVARWILTIATVAYSAISIVIIWGVVPDPGVFAADLAVDRASLAVAAIFVLGTFVLAFQTARMFRGMSLAAIEDLQTATRLASQREAVMDELRAELERALRVGGPGRYSDRVVGKFKLGVVLGRGSIGEIYEGVHVETAAPAAVKLLRRELLADATQVARFLREARASGAIASQHVVRVLDASTSEATLPYLVTERLTGHTLGELLRREDRLDQGAILEIARHAGEGIDAAAAAGIVHRDLKPQNLMRDGEPWKILDFGVATFNEDAGALTHGEAVGTPHYMSPEQAQGKPVDHRTDVYALGAILYRCITGRHPFQAADTPALLYAVVHRMPPRPGELRELDPDVDRWCALALAKSLSDRFAGGAELAAALAAAFAGELDGKLRSRADALVRRQPWEAP
ncbi:MAG: serine/threonine-protein kinase [Kofleriaceae bacterium]